MFIIKSIPAEKELILMIRNISDEEELKSIRFLLNREIIKLDPGWTAVADWRHMKVLEQRLIPYIQQMQDLLFKNDAERMVILVDNMIFKMQLLRISTTAGNNERVFLFTDPGEWKRFLAIPPKFNRPKRRL